VGSHVPLATRVPTAIAARDADFGRHLVRFAASGGAFFGSEKWGGEGCDEGFGGRLASGDGADTTDAAVVDELTHAGVDARQILGRAVAEAIDLRRRRALLDVAGGSGIYACCLVAQHPHLKATVLEKRPVDTVARAAIAKRGFAGTVWVVAGDMFKDSWPAGFDVHLISNVLHDWDVPVVKKILARSFESMAPGGLVVIHDAHLNAGKSGPLHVAEYSAMLMHSTEGRCYSVAEMREYLREVGYRFEKFTPTAAGRSIVTARKPA